jgi:hypothetical protein
LPPNSGSNFSSLVHKLSKRYPDFEQAKGIWHGRFESRQNAKMNPLISLVGKKVPACFVRLVVKSGMPDSTLKVFLTPFETVLFDFIPLFISPRKPSRF